MDHLPVFLYVDRSSRMDTRLNVSKNRQAKRKRKVNPMRIQTRLMLTFSAALALTAGGAHASTPQEATQTVPDPAPRQNPPTQVPPGQNPPVQVPPAQNPPGQNQPAPPEPKPKP